jgi:hypothetical protein
MNIEKIFKECVNVEGFNNESKQLLDRLMAIATPMSFDDDFATDAQLDALITEMDRCNTVSSEADRLVSAVERLEPYQSNRFVFIG